MKHLTTLFFVLLFPLCVMAQEVFEWENPSFEGEPKATTMPAGWQNLYPGKAYSSVDIQPGFFGCSTTPQHGKSYIGMVVREDGSHEGLYQNLVVSLQKDSMYTFSLWACLSSTYASPTSFSYGEHRSFYNPVRLMIIGINKKTNKQEILLTSEIIKSTIWQKIEFSFIVPDKDLNAIGIVAIPVDETDVFYNGHILIDNLSKIKKIPFSTAVWKNIQPDKRVQNKKMHIPLNNYEFIGFAGRPEDHSWDLFVASKDSLKFYSVVNKIYDHPYQDGLNKLIANDEMEPHINNGGLYMVGNKNGKWTGVGQSLEEQLMQDSSYNWSLVLSKGKIGELNENKEPLRLYIWGGTQENPRQELLVKTYGIDNKIPKKYTYSFTPLKGNWDYIYFETHSITDGITYYNGNMVVQSCQPIQKVKKK